VLRTGWWQRSSHMIIGQLTMIFLTHHNYVWHPESLYGVSWLQPTSKVNGANPGSRLRWSMPTWWTTPQSGNLVSPFYDNSGLSWTLSAPVKGIAVPVERHGVLQTCGETQTMSRILRSWTVVCPSFTLLIMLLLPGWPTMGLNRIRKKKNCSRYTQFFICRLVPLSALVITFSFTFQIFH